MILIIRPKTETNTIVHDLKERNCSLFVEPVSEIKFINLKTNFDSNGFFLISSLQTVKALALLKNIDQQFLDNANFLVIGNKTAQRCKSLGIKNINKVFVSSLDLIDYLDQNKQINQLNHLTGSVKNEILEEWSKINRQLIKKTILYDVEFISKLSEECCDHIKNRKFDFMFHYSLKSAEVFLSLLNKFNRNHVLRDINHLCLSQRIADGLIECGIIKERVFHAKIPEHDALMLQFDHIRT